MVFNRARTLRDNDLTASRTGGVELLVPEAGGRQQVEAHEGAEILTCADAAGWESWLAEHHHDSGGVWLLIAKKGSERASVSIGDALDVALCYGWIDSQRKAYDADRYLQRYTPRRPRSPWSRLNVERVEALIDAGRMRAPGLAEVAAARADGRWVAAYERQRNARPPADLAAALEQNEQARTAYERLDKTGRYLLALPILKATTPAMRLRRLQKAIATLEGRKERRAQPRSRSSTARQRTSHTCRGVRDR